MEFTPIADQSMVGAYVHVREDALDANACFARCKGCLVRHQPMLVFHPTFRRYQMLRGPLECPYWAGCGRSALYGSGGFVRSADLHPPKMLRHGRMAGLVKLRSGIGVLDGRPLWSENAAKMKHADIGKANIVDVFA